VLKTINTTKYTLSGTVPAIALILSVFLFHLPSFLLAAETANQLTPETKSIQAISLNKITTGVSTQHNNLIYGINLDNHIKTPLILFLLISLSYALYRIRSSRIAQYTSEDRMRLALEGTQSGLLDWNIEDNKLFLCHHFEAMLGYAPGELGNSMTSLIEFIHPDDIQHIKSKLREHLKGNSELFESEHRFKHKSGKWIWMYGRGMIVNRDMEQKATRLVGTQTDISERKKAEEHLQQTALVFETIAEAVVICDENSRIISVNQAFSDITGYSREEVIGSNPNIFQSGKHDANFYHRMWDSIINDGSWQGEICNKNKDGNFYTEWLSIATIRGSDGNIDKYIAVFRDITKRKQDEELIRYQANYDALTELPNRHLLMDRLGFELQRSSRENTMVALLFIDLDRFKPINDTYGHMVGDQLLWEVSKRLTNHVRESDMVARLGGDEFTIILPNIEDIREVERMASRILKGVASPYSLDGRELIISASIGITIFPDDADNITSLMTNADNAMYLAKEEGRNTFCFFTSELNEHAKVTLRIENDLHHSVQKKELIPYFQPIIDIGSGEVIAAEVLLRWKHPEFGIMLPDSFIPIAEATGLIVDIGKWLLEVVCCQVMRWRNDGVNLNRICVNVSGRQFRDNLISIVENALESSGLEPECLELEVVETILLEENKETAHILNSLCEMGVRLTIDDFGTGYSSLSYLKKYPFDALKINHSFVCGLPNNKDDSTLVNTMISMAHELGLEVIAEGVETKEQLDYLRAQGCNMAQGFHSTKPMPANKFEKWLLKTQAT